MKKIDESEVLNMATTIQVRVEDELKGKSDALFKDLGTGGFISPRLASFVSYKIFLVNYLLCICM